MGDLKKLFVQTGIYSLFLAVPCICIAFFAFGWRSAAGIVIGLALGMTGLFLIIRFARSIGTDPKARRAGLIQYVLRYCLYGIVMAFFAWRSIPVLAMLAGFMCTKGAILIYSQKLRKEADDVSS